MLSFYEHLAQREPALPDPLTMLAKAGINPGGPSEVEVLRMIKREKKWDDLAKVHGASAEP